MPVTAGHYRKSDLDYTELLDLCKKGQLRLGKQVVKDLTKLGIGDHEQARKEINNFIFTWMKEGKPVDQWKLSATQPGEFREGFGWDAKAGFEINGKGVPLKVALANRGWEICGASA